MQAYRVNTTIQEDGTLTVSHLPLPTGEAVEVIILVQPSTARPQDRYPLRGMPITYIDPTEPVAEADWEAAR
jgi:NADPH:quinone reductase-like Zn-dependent oxidoreductase